MSNLLDEQSTIKSVISELANLKISTLITILTIGASFIGGVFTIGRMSGQRGRAIDTQQEFDIKIYNNLEFKNLVIVKDENIVSADPTLQIYSLKIIQNEFNNKAIGEVAVHNK